MNGGKDGWVDVRMDVWMRNPFNIAVLMLEFNVSVYYLLLVFRFND